VAAPSSGNVAAEQAAYEIKISHLPEDFKNLLKESLALMKKDTISRDRELVCHAKFCTTERRVVYQTKS
jgi:hypothetical protein